MAEVKKDTKVAVKPLPEPKDLHSVRLRRRPRPSIRSARNKLLAELARAAATRDSKFKPDMDRRKELLENYPLDHVQDGRRAAEGGINYALLQIDQGGAPGRSGSTSARTSALVTA